MMKISACVITKNEEKNIGFYLDSLKSYVDEIILVDTGSTDQTACIAGRYHINVYHYPWRDDFAAAKNFALDKAKGEWIVFLDADEFFSEISIKKLRHILTCYGAFYDIFLCRMVNIDVDDGNKPLDSFYTARIFRNLPHIRYAGRIHEQLKSLSAEKLRIKALAPEELVIYHTGYSTGKVKEKARRNLRLLRSETDRETEANYVYFAEAYAALDDNEQALYYAKLDIASGKKDITYASRSYRIAIESLKGMGRPAEEIAAAIETAMENFPDLPDFYAEYGLLFYNKQEYGRAHGYFTEALRRMEIYEGPEPCVAGNSVDLLRRLSEETARCNAPEKGEAMEQKDEAVERKNKAFYQSIMAKITEKMRFLAAVLLTGENEASVKEKKLLPRELSVVIDRYYSHDVQFKEEQFFLYFSLLDTVIQLRHEKVLQRYLQIGGDFSTDLQMKILETLAERRVVLGTQAFLAGFNGTEGLDKEACYFLGKLYYLRGDYSAAESYFSSARQLGSSRRDINSYLRWTADRR